MGRLFWKFFFFFWLAQFVTSVGVGVSMWVSHPVHAPDRPPPAEMRPPPGAGAPPIGGPIGRLPPVPEPPLFPPLMPIVWGSLVSLLFAALLAWYVARPIRLLRASFAGVAGGRLETRVGSAMGARNDELADLGKEFDVMADRLQALLASQRRLLHDVSHELRSPLARLQAAADLVRQQPDRTTEFVTRIERDTARIDRLVGELLTLARLDAGMAGNLDEDADLHEIVADIADGARFEAAARNVAVEVAGDSHIAVRGNPELIHRALENVVRNAVRHSPADSAIELGIRFDAATGRVRLTVSDHGSGVSSGDLEVIFTPFFRSATADAYSGYGLGLAIARSVALAHGGGIDAANRSDGGLAVTLELPNARSV